MGMITQEIEFECLMDAMRFARNLPHKTIYRITDVVKLTKLPIETINKKLDILSSYQLLYRKPNAFMLYRNVIMQSDVMFQKIMPSLISLKHAKYFNKKYDQTDIDFALEHMPCNSIITLDYKAAELTGYQHPWQLYVYVDDINTFESLLKHNGFNEGKKEDSRVVLLPKIGSFENLLKRLFFDCVASGGRDFMDAVAIMVLYGHEIMDDDIMFPKWAIDKVLEDLPLCRK